MYVQGVFTHGLSETNSLAITNIAKSGLTINMEQKGCTDTIVRCHTLWSSLESLLIKREILIVIFILPIAGHFM